MPDQQAGRTGFLHCRAKCQHAEDQHQDVPADRAIGFLMVQASERNDGCCRNQRERRNRQHAQRSQPHHRHQRDNRDGCLAPSHGALGRLGKIVENAIIKQLTHAPCRTLQQDRVAHVEADVVCIGDILPAPVDRQHVDTIEACQAEPIQRPAGQPRLRPDHAFHDDGLAGLDRFKGRPRIGGRRTNGDAACLLQCQDF